MSQSVLAGCITPGQPPGISSKRFPGGSGFDFWKLPGGREFDGGRDFVEIETFCPSIGFISHKQRVSRKLVEIGEHCTVDFQFRLRCSPHVCLGGDLCSPFFGNYSGIPCVKIGFNINDVLRMMNEGCFPECGRFHFLLSSWTLLLLAGNSLFVIQRAKLLHMNTVVS